MGVAEHPLAPLRTWNDTRTRMRSERVRRAVVLEDTLRRRRRRGPE